MNLFEYTRKVSEKIKLYDTITKDLQFKTYNPFAKPITLTVIWVENEKE